MIKLKFIPIVLPALLSLNLQAQGQDHSAEHADHPHHHHKNEIGIANSPVYFVNEKEFAYGFHAHYIRTIGDSKFGIGAGFERIFDEHKHNTLGIVASYRPIEPLSFNISPGITFEDEHPEAAFALHLETSYEFELKDFHIGPLLEFAFDPEDWHISFGLHIGYGF